MRLLSFLFRIGLVLACAVPLTPEQGHISAPQRVVPLAQSDELVVLIRNGATSFFVDAEGKYAGLEYDLVTRFAQGIGKRVRFVVTPRAAEVPKRLAQGEAHLAVGVLQSAVHRPGASIPALAFGPVYLRLQPVVVYRSEEAPPASAEALAGRLLQVEGVFAGAMPSIWPKAPALPLAEEQDSEELVERVASRNLDYAIVESRGASAAQNVYPEVATAFDLGAQQDVSWAWPAGTAPDLAERVQAFFELSHKNGTLGRLLDRYFGHLQRLQAVDASEFLARRVALLPKFKRYFFEAEAQYGIDWRLLAALAYQESHWDPLATSSYGVRGLMMLTEDTADRLGVKDRLDPRESIMGGARYLANLKSMLPAVIAEPDRSWMALAAYNIGIAHLSDARTLARRLKKNPDSWSDLKSVIPLLRNARYHSSLKFGFARGGETVIFVENLRSYYDILSRFEAGYKNVFPPFLEQITVSNPDNIHLGVELPRRQSLPSAP